MREVKELIEYHVSIDVGDMKGVEVDALQQQINNDVNFYETIRDKNDLIVRVFVDKSQDVGEIKDRIREDLNVIYRVPKDNMLFVSVIKGKFSKVMSKDQIVKYYANVTGNIHYNEKDEASMKSIKRVMLSMDQNSTTQIEKEILIPQIIDDFDIKKKLIESGINTNDYTNKLGQGVRDKLIILKAQCHCKDGTKFSRDTEVIFSVWKSVQLIALNFEVKYEPIFSHTIVLKNGIPYSYKDFEAQSLSMSLSYVNNALDILKLIKGVRFYALDEIIEKYCSKPNPTIDGINKLQELYGFEDNPKYRNKENFIQAQIDYFDCQMSAKEIEPSKQLKPYVTTVFAGGSGMGKTTLMTQLYNHTFLFDKYYIRTLVFPSKSSFNNDGRNDATLAYGTLANIGGLTHGFDDIKTGKEQEISDKQQSSPHQTKRGMRSQQTESHHFCQNRVTTSNDPYNYIHDLMGNDRRVNIHVATKRVTPSMLSEDLKIEIFSYIYNEWKNNKNYQDNQLSDLEKCRMKNNAENHAPIYIKMCEFLNHFDNDLNSESKDKQLNINGIKEVLGLPKDFKSNFDDILTLTVNTNVVHKEFRDNTAYYSIMKKIVKETKLI